MLLYVSGMTYFGLLMRRKVFRRYGVYVLSYHHVVDNGTPDALGHHVTVKRFEEQIRFLKKWFDIVSLEDALKLLGKGILRRDYIAITFDDGYADNYKIAFPILRKFDVSATIFLITGLVGTNQLAWYDECKVYLRHFADKELPPVRNKTLHNTLFRLHEILRDRGSIEVTTERAVDFLKTVDNDVRQEVLDWLRIHFQDASADRANLQIMTWDQVRELAADGITFGSHTVSHPILARLPADEMKRELRVSKETIEHKLGTRCVLFAYPNGAEEDFNPRITESIRTLGYHGACTQIFGSNRPGTDPFTLKRIGIGNIPRYVLAAKLSGVLTLVFDARRQSKTWRSMPWPFITRTQPQ